MDLENFGYENLVKINFTKRQRFVMKPQVNEKYSSHTGVLYVVTQLDDNKQVEKLFINQKLTRHFQSAALCPTTQ